jgi:hypothetical protein
MIYILDFKVEGTVISSQKCKFPTDGESLYIHIQSTDGSGKEEHYEWATSFPARFSIRPFGRINGSVSAVIVGRSGVVQFVTDNPVPFSAMN